MKSTNSPKSDQSLRQFIAGGRTLGMAAVFYHQAVADHYGVSASDSRYASLIRDRGSLTAGELADISGLTTGAVTGIIDRLEAAKLVKRVPSPTDRRQVIVQPSDERLAETQALFTSLAKRAQKLVDGYTQQERQVILGFISQWSNIMQEEATQLQRARPRK